MYRLDYHFDWLWVRLQAVWHQLKGHLVEWRVNVDGVCSGDIVCETCGLVLWCRLCDPWNRWRMR